jgi:hypothetical protein
VAEQQTSMEEDFDTAFANLSLMAEGQQPPPPEDEPAETASEDEAPEAPEAPAEESGEAPDDSDADEEPPATLSDEELLARFAALVKKADPAQPTTQQAPQQQAPSQEEPPIYTPEEAEFLQNYEKDWPDVSKAEALRRRAEYRHLVSYVFREVATQFRPIMETVEVLSQRTHLNDLQSTVTDYEDVRDKVVAWVDTQPTYLQTAYKHVITSGTVEEVADLIDRYKRDTGAQIQTAPAPAKKEAELPTATRQAAAALAPVSSKRTAVVQAADPNDFESAFASFAEKL